MKKMYNNPKTEVVAFDSKSIMQSIGEGSDAAENLWGAPTRGAYNPNGR